ncbi:Gram-positive pilin backbone subunit 2, Cna-B-like domain-containing protein [Bifidobacterium pseudolongum subsp. globosum]|uniref:Gram-positive pilin backbone subunit 2, Cna-B-like domain-containing protein n=1 Tax=Bifidobacterium pseudolongum subsp. globosum TaxID=1690 RepID=A0A4Q5AMN8_9BIFI|nr:isopeptide-forming domain-containing fimbrial protein [Bifidobacterium pseudolongum]RYQ23334.1 Gram-positive pilin backbone subunit 2, Cna-B-like domain-containing protein [Bifidobacterium pseudolongum subsp. globosum]RYQ31790.1 Gram-positive pilin backbone subunit 2, Cna-B-like domain-containing protein [Bifidobacterium pseudolongum subsp. globosum]
MKKVWKGFAAAVSAAAIAATGFIGATSANAADGDVKVTITDATSADQKFVAYRVLNATNNGDNYAYTINTKYSAQLKTATGLPLNGTDEQNNKAVTDHIAPLTAAQMKVFADKLWVAIANTKPAVTPDVSEFTGKTGGASFSGPQGYYLIRQTSAGDNDALSSVIVNTAGQNGVDVTLKKNVPTVEKKVQNVNDSSNTTSGWQDSADHDVNDKVNFMLTGTTSTYVNDFKQYKFEFKDTMSAGLTFVQAGDTVAAGDVTVKIDGTAITSGYTVTLADVPTGTAAPYTGGKVLTVSFADLLAAAKAANIKLDGGDVVTVEYKATLNESAVIGSAGNPNKVDLTFANDPHYSGAGANEPTGTTPEDEVIVFTYEVNADKVTSDNKPLEGASFALLKWFEADKVWKVYQHAKAADGTNPAVAAGWVALPSGVTIANKAAIATLSQTDAAKIPGTAAENKEGKWTVNFPRIDDGDYAIVETVVPAGYNYAAPTQFTITGNLVTTQPTGGAITGTWGAPATGNNDVTVSSGGTISTSIVNNAGNRLPSTGGMGTTILYVAGAVIVLIAGIGLAVTLRRRQA